MAKVKDRSDSSMPPLPPEDIPMLEVKGWRDRGEGYPRLMPK